MKYLITDKIFTTFEVFVYIVAATVSTRSIIAGDHWFTILLRIIAITFVGLILSQLLKGLVKWLQKRPTFKDPVIIREQPRQQGKNYHQQLFMDDCSQPIQVDKCQAEQLGNEMHCMRCKSCWTLDNHNPPKCLPEYSKSKAFANYINASLFTRIRCIWSKQQTYVNTDRHISNSKFFEGCEIDGKIYQVVK